MWQVGLWPEVLNSTGTRRVGFGLAEARARPHSYQAIHAAHRNAVGVRLRAPPAGGGQRLGSCLVRRAAKLLTQKVSSSEAFLRSRRFPSSSAGTKTAASAPLFFRYHLGAFVGKALSARELVLNRRASWRPVTGPKIFHGLRHYLIWTRWIDTSHHIFSPNTYRGFTPRGGGTGACWSGGSGCAAP